MRSNHTKSKQQRGRKIKPNRKESKVIHQLKSWPDIFQAVVDGLKTFEVRKNDRNFKVGDGIILNEWKPGEGYSGEYTGRRLSARIIYILDGRDDFGFNSKALDDTYRGWGLLRGFVCMQLDRISTCH